MLGKKAGQPGHKWRLRDALERGLLEFKTFGLAPEEDRQRIERLAQLLLERRDGRAQRRDHCLLLRHIEPRGRTDRLVELQSLEGRLRAREVVVCDVQSILQLERREKSIGYARHDAELDGFAVVTAGVGERDGGGTRREILAPEIELVARGQLRAEAVVERRHGRGESLARSRNIGIQKWQQGSTRDAYLRIRLAHARYGGCDVVVCANGLGDEPIKLCRAEATPPVFRGPLRGTDVRAAPRRGRRNVRPVIARPEIAAGEGAQRQYGKPARRRG
jgi:hypothetical protein